MQEEQVMRPRDVVIALVSGLGVWIVGVGALVIDWRPAALVLDIFPTSFIFRFLPKAMTESLSDRGAFWLGVVSAVTFWWMVSWVLIVGGRQMARLNRAHAAPR